AGWWLAPMLATAAARSPPAARARPCPHPARTGGGSNWSLNDLGGLEQHVRRDREPERLGGPEGGGEVEPRRPLGSQLAGFRPLEDFVHVDHLPSLHVENDWPVDDEPPGQRELPAVEHRRQPSLQRLLRDLSSVSNADRVRQQDAPIGPLARRGLQ